LLVGKTATGIGTAGFEVSPNGYFYATRNGNSMALNRLTTDGDLAVFQKDGSTVGSIGTSGGSMTLGSDDTGLRFSQFSDAVVPHNTATNSTRDAAIDLGSSGARFKDLYLSGGVVFGSTGGAVTSKTLDDYEVGTFTPVLTGSTSGTLSASTLTQASYVKIGDLVQIAVYLAFDTTSHSLSGNIALEGLPFSGDSFSGLLTVQYTNLFTFDETAISAGGYFNGSKFLLTQGSSANIITDSQLTSSASIVFMATATYKIVT